MAIQGINSRSYMAGQGINSRSYWQNKEQHNN